MEQLAIQFEEPKSSVQTLSITNRVALQQAMEHPHETIEQLRQAKNELILQDIGSILAQSEITATEVSTEDDAEKSSRALQLAGVAVVSVIGSFVNYKVLGTGIVGQEYVETASTGLMATLSGATATGAQIPNLIKAFRG